MNGVEKRHADLMNDMERTQADLMDGVQRRHADLMNGEEKRHADLMNDVERRHAHLINILWPHYNSESYLDRDFCYAFRMKSELNLTAYRMDRMSSTSGAAS